MANYARHYADAPTQAEIDTGYAPSEVRRSPFAKFLFWTFAGLGITFVVTYGVVWALDEVQRLENSRYARMSNRGVQEFAGPRLQPSPGHDNIDWLDTQLMLAGNQKELAAKGWKADDQKYWKTTITDKVVEKTAAAISAK